MKPLLQSVFTWSIHSLRFSFIFAKFVRPVIYFFSSSLLGRLLHQQKFALLRNQSFPNCRMRLPSPLRVAEPLLLLAIRQLLSILCLMLLLEALVSAGNDACSLSNNEFGGTCPEVTYFIESE